jgi:hypothetical protein
MTTQEIYIVEPSTSEEAKALKAFAKALKIKITKQENSSNIKKDISQAVTELNLIKEGKIKGLSAKELLNEL